MPSARLAGHGARSHAPRMFVVTGPVGEPGEKMIDAGERTTAALRQMTAEQLLHLGTRQVVYLKTGKCDGEQAFGVFGADGTPLVVVHR